MSLITPDIGLIFWMVLIFGILFVILAKFGFPAIVGMVGKRTDGIRKALRDAEEAEERMRGLSQEQQALIEKTHSEQYQMLREASAEKERIISQAAGQAKAEADKILAQAREEIAVEKDRAVKDIRAQVAMLSVDIAEKVLRREMADEAAQRKYAESLADKLAESQVGIKS